ncbi:MAG: DUF5326 family protein [Fimbriimonadaceae bacterium]|nr:DUF5326 family protein [Fimbriimonadaceae bacterium]QYK55314.1 MAG: DUF5326 family protein [Fimbriimonadaceae bacterium]
MGSNNGIGKLLLYIALGVLALWLAGSVLTWAIALVFKVLIPVLVIGGLGYLVYRAFSRKSLTGSDRRSLP